MQFCRLTAVRMTDTTNGSPDARASSPVPAGLNLLFLHNPCAKMADPDMD